MAAHVRHDGIAVDLRSPVDEIRARAIRDAAFLRALAWRAVRDGLPKAELRAASARAAARSVLRHARQIETTCGQR